MRDMRGGGARCQEEAATTPQVAPLGAADVNELIALAGEIWRQHYADIISAAQIEYT